MRIYKWYPIYISLFSIIQESKKNGLDKVEVEVEFDYYEVLNFFESKRIDNKFRNFKKIESKKITVNIEDENECIDNIKKVIKETFTNLWFNINDIIYDNKYNIFKFIVSNIWSFNIQNLIDEYISNYNFRYSIEYIENKILEHINKNNKEEVSLSLSDLEKNIFEQEPIYFMRWWNEVFVDWMVSKLWNNNQVEDIFYVVLWCYLELFLMKLYLDWKIKWYEKVWDGLYSISKNELETTKAITINTTVKNENIDYTNMLQIWEHTYYKSNIIYHKWNIFKLKNTYEHILIKVLLDNIWNKLDYQDIETKMSEYWKKIKKWKTSIAEKIDFYFENIFRENNELNFMKDIIKDKYIPKY